MEITRIYKEDSEIEDLTNDRVQITMTLEEFNTLMCELDLSRFEAQSKEDCNKIFKKLDLADAKAKIKWVK